MYLWEFLCISFIGDLLSDTFVKFEQPCDQHLLVLSLWLLHVFQICLVKCTVGQLMIHTDLHMFWCSHPHSVECGLLYENIEKSHPKKFNIRANSSSCILLQYISCLLVSPFCDWSSAIHYNASKILRKDFKIAAVAIACASHLVSERDFKTLSFPIQLLRSFHQLVEAEKKV